MWANYDYTYYRPRHKRYSYMTGNDVEYTYGTSGNETGRRSDSFETGRFLFWTEDCYGCEHRLCQANVVSNRMHAAVDEKHSSYYVYDHSGERRVKLTGTNDLMDVNADYMYTASIMKEPTIYPSAYMVMSNRGYTKHYYAGTERVAARIGGGGLNVIYSDQKLSDSASVVFHQSLKQINDRHLENNEIDCIANGLSSNDKLTIDMNEVPERMIAKLRIDYSEFWRIIANVQNIHHNEPDVYFYHSDHLGSASWITDNGGLAVQHLQYLPYGERYVDQRAAGYHERFTFTGKERDEETGYGYFGARYMDHELMTMWLSVDPMADKYPSMSPYSYCAWNPMKLVDPNGEEIWIKTDRYNENAPRIKWTTDGLFNEDGSKYTGDDTFVLQTASALNAIYADNEALLSEFMGKSEYDIYISETTGQTMYNESKGGSEQIGFLLSQVQSIDFNPTMGLAQCKPDAVDEEYMAPFLCLLHEFGHAYNAVTDYESYSNRKKTETGDAYGNNEEKFVIKTYEQPASAKHGMLQRTSHKNGFDGLRIIKTEGPMSSKPIR